MKIDTSPKGKNLQSMNTLQLGSPTKVLVIKSQKFVKTYLIISF